jgi:hypothetical protein
MLDPELVTLLVSLFGIGGTLIGVILTQTSGVGLTQPQVRDYILELERAGLIISPQTSYSKEHVLTVRGKWVVEIIGQVLPSRTLLYLLRDFLGYRNLPSKAEHLSTSPQSSSEASS